MNKTSEVDQEAKVKALVFVWAVDSMGQLTMAQNTGKDWMWGGGGWLCCDMLNCRVIVRLSSDESQ